MKEIQRKKSVRREIKLMERLNHPHIAKLYEAIETEDYVVLVMECIAGVLSSVLEILAQLNNG